MGNRFDIHSKYSYGLIAMLVAPLVHYAVTSALYKSADRTNNNDKKAPPIVPHFLPIFGIIPWQYFWSPIEFFRSRYGNKLCDAVCEVASK
jgi:hypothetical protein